MLIPIIILSIAFILIATRQIGNIRLQIWQIMSFGAIAVLITGQIAPSDAVKSINIDVMLFLFGMFVVGEALQESGYLSHILYKFFKKAKSVDSLILFILFGMGIASALLMNDTLAIIGTPAVPLLARKHNISAKLLLLTLAFSITIGSVMSPIGNPQNLLIAVDSNIKNPFIVFLRYLFLPTAANLFLTFVLLKFFFNEHFKNGSLKHSQEPIRDAMLASLCKISLMLILTLVIIKVIISISLNPELDFRLTHIALIAAFPILAFSNRRTKIIKNIDWHTLIFFAAMFVLMQAVWDSGFFQGIMAGLNINVTAICMILGVSVALSQFISNVPLVALYLPMLIHAGASTKEMIALAAGSTIAGNLFILGAASNVIIIQNAEKRHQETLTFLVYWLFFVIV